MLKQLTLAALVGALLPACVIGTDDTTTSISGSSSSSDGTTGLTSSTDPTGGTTEQTTVEGTTIAPTTGDTTTVTPTTGDTTLDTVTTATDSTATDATDGTTGNTTGEGGFGKCGWLGGEDLNYYACEADGAVASLEDPEGISPIACAPGLMAGDPCDERGGPVKGVGCCTPEGTLYYCDSDESLVIFEEQCGT